MTWRLIAWVLSRRPVADWLIARAQRTPYTHLGPNGEYMGRWWVFNPNPRGGVPRWPRLPSVRVHHIKRPDQERHVHDHPGDARTIILRGYYMELRPRRTDQAPIPAAGVFIRKRGDTATLKQGEFHRVARVSDGGVWTLFFTWGWTASRDWGFLVDGVRVPWREYLGDE